MNELDLFSDKKFAVQHNKQKTMLATDHFIIVANQSFLDRIDK